MNFILLETLEVYKSKTRPIIGELLKYDGKLKYLITPAVLTTYDMFDIFKERVKVEDSKNYQIVSDTVQKRTVVKAIHKSSKGYYYKIDGKSVYLNQDDVEELEFFMEYVRDYKIKELQEQYDKYNQ